MEVGGRRLEGRGQACRHCFRVYRLKRLILTSRLNIYNVMCT